ncbi:MAG: UDP-4-amino-4,6-dideoxy-N-acetyl-beta-L-altrosamine transaminase [Legionellaceae bacterium]|nr:UDP-4-amino-4,6-dideoxy-N-acetyl-beta-L-altrosamine transaminase [Legionellaceae bacterium]
MIPYGRQDVTDVDIAAVNDVLQSDWLTQGPCVPRFEEAIAHRVGAEYGVAVNSGTSALHVACLALGLGAGDWLWTSPNTFVASANCGLYCGAQIDFVDIDPQTYNMSVQALSEKLEQAEIHGKLPKVIIPVHFAGQSCDMEAIHKLSKRYGFKIIEDASHAIGGLYKNLPIGCGRYGDITVFSFHPVKLITTGEGGMAVTNSSEFAERMVLLRSHGITRDPKKMANIVQGEWYYEQVELGLNYRMTDMQAALGLSQLERLDNFVRQRHQFASVYNIELTGLPLLLPFQHQDVYSAFHLYVVQLEENSNYIGGRDKLFNQLRQAGIGVNVHYIPVHTQPYYQALGFQSGQFSEAEKYYERAITLPLYPGLEETELSQVVELLRSELLA